MQPKPGAKETAALRRAFEASEAQQRITNIKVGCALVVFLMPAGSLLDFFVYPHQLWPFFCLRISCSALAGIIWAFLSTEVGHRTARGLGVIVPLLPAAFIAAMIALQEGFDSPYYAGLNLVMLAVGAVLRWSLLESIITVLLVTILYSAAGTVYAVRAGVTLDPNHIKNIVSNFYFMLLMDLVVVVGTYFQKKAQFREFQLRYQLDRNRQELEESNQKLKELDEIKSRFFANISHELRTPLTLLLAPLETLLHRFQLDAQSKDLLQTMHANGMRLLKLINDLLDLVRLESGRMEVKWEPVELSGFLKGLASAARQVAEGKRISLEAHADPGLGCVLADRDKLERIVLNLVFNAFKFTPAGGRVMLRAEKQGEQLVLTVADTGKGIAEKNLPYVFDRFWQADGSSRRKSQGAGIGLALVKELVEIQGGQVAVGSVEGKGATFTVRLPYQKADPVVPMPGLDRSQQPTPEPLLAAVEDGTVSSGEWLANLYRRAELFPAMTSPQDAPRPIESTQDSHLPTLLVAEDEPDMRRFLKSQLSLRYRVLEAADGQQAIEKASQFLPDIILLDLMMPEKDGLQACREIREHTPTQNIPILLLTARADEETKLAALAAGANDFLAKPFSTTELQVRTKNLVQSHQYQRNLSKQNQMLEATIEQLKQTETQLVQSEKLASLGRMSAGIIHEINNPLNFASTGLFTLRDKAKHLVPEQQEEYREILRDVEDGLTRIKNIVLDLRTFTHPQTSSRDEVVVAEAVAAALRLTSNEWKDKVRIEQNLAECQTIWANKNRIIQVLVNLLQNSLDAMRRKTYSGESPAIRIEGRVEGGKSLLVIRDNGTGIDSRHLDKIFDPFFTTKDVGEGMGLGLAICYRTVQECQGRISARSEPGRFCEFTLEFPVKG